ncbi:hypothetical protein DNTS_027980, partial [Danionella cerebrum]
RNTSSSSTTSSKDGGFTTIVACPSPGIALYFLYIRHIVIPKSSICGGLTWSGSVAERDGGGPRRSCRYGGPPSILSTLNKPRWPSSSGAPSGHLRAAVRTSPCVRMMWIRRKSRRRAQAGRGPTSPAPAQNTAPPPDQEEEPHTRFSKRDGFVSYPASAPEQFIVLGGVVLHSEKEIQRELLHKRGKAGRREGEIPTTERERYRQQRGRDTEDREEKERYRRQRREGEIPKADERGRDIDDRGDREEIGWKVIATEGSAGARGSVEAVNEGSETHRCHCRGCWEVWVVTVDVLLLKHKNYYRQKLLAIGHCKALMSLGTADVNSLLERKREKDRQTDRKREGVLVLAIFLEFPASNGRLSSWQEFRQGTLCCTGAPGDKEERWKEKKGETIFSAS